MTDPRISHALEIIAQLEAITALIDAKSDLYIGGIPASLLSLKQTSDWQAGEVRKAYCLESIQDSARP
ncbi:hypothetical protein [Brevundimonas sp.]|uniref:hypothetical protein n=1 Tax=Brevundimonas sp. TaxID=1871086 RepID=UPI0035AF70BA